MGGCESASTGNVLSAGMGGGVGGAIRSWGPPYGVRGPPPHPNHPRTLRVSVPGGRASPVGGAAIAAAGVPTTAAATTGGALRPGVRRLKGRSYVLHRVRNASKGVCVCGGLTCACVWMHAHVNAPAQHRTAGPCALPSSSSAPPYRQFHVFKHIIAASLMGAAALHAKTRFHAAKKQGLARGQHKPTHHDSFTYITGKRVRSTAQPPTNLRVYDTLTALSSSSISPASP